MNLATVTKADLQAEVKRLQRALAQSRTKLEVRDKSLDRATKRIATVNKSVAAGRERERLLRREVSARNAELMESVDQQTATSEILRIIISSPTDTQPVFDAIVSAGVHLFGDTDLTLRLLKGNQLEMAACTLPPGNGNVFSFPLDVQSASSRAVLRKEVVQLPDVLAEDWIAEAVKEQARIRGRRAALTAPMMREDQVLGTIAVNRTAAGSYTEKEVALLKTFADQAVIAIENVRLFKELQAKNAELTETLEQQTATADILKVISGSPTDTQRVFHAIAETCQRLVHGKAVGLLLVRQGKMEPVALLGEGGEALQPPPPQPLDRGSVPGTSILDCRVIHVPDYEAVADTFPRIREMGISRGYKSGLYVPLLQYGKAIGSLGVRRGSTGEFTEKEIALLQTFAAQAVIAIENARLFNETKEALEQQTATAEILRVISGSPTDLQPVFDAILGNALRLCDAHMGHLGLYDGEMYQYVAQRGANAEYAKFLSERGPFRPAGTLGCMVAERQPVHVEDTRNTPEYRDRRPGVVAQVELGAGRTYLAVPMLKEGRVVGGISIYRPEVRPFTHKQIELVSMFADQAVIAIENVRLFKELQTSNAGLIESLEQQTAISEILRVISASPTDIQPVLDTIVQRASRICEANDVRIFLVDGDRLRHAAGIGGATAYYEIGEARPVDRSLAMGRAVIDRVPFQIEDLSTALAKREFPSGYETYKRYGHRTVLAVPLLREDRALGAILLRRMEVRPFTARQIDLLKTFADQAAIAIENVRLFKELQARNAEVTQALEQQTATSEILRVISSSPTETQPVFDAIVKTGVHLFSGVDMTLRLVKDNQSVIVATTEAANDAHTPSPLADDRRASVRAILRREIVHVPDIFADEGVTSGGKERARQRNHAARLFAPLVRENVAIGVIGVSRATPGPFTEKEIALLKTFADQAVIAIENVRLFNEIQEKSRQLEIANRHKSEFLANMSHELRTPLNAVIGFSEVLQQGMVGELNDKQGEYIEYIHKSGSHLLSLINDILDLSKVEAGRMELDLTDFSVPMAIDNALTLVRERATRHGLALDCTLDPAIAEINADERKFKQILLNLLSNAVKFTPENGRITVSARALCDTVEVSVTDTGIGIAPEDCDSVFEEFRQVGDNAERKAEGTGLGLALTKRFIELHGGRIWLSSEIGKGSTFFFTLPMTQPFQVAT